MVVRQDRQGVMPSPGGGVDASGASESGSSRFDCMPDLLVPRSRGSYFSQLE